MDFKRTWDLASIPDEFLRAEWARRNSLRRVTRAGGRPPAELSCAFCSAEYNSLEMRKHRPSCRQGRLFALGSSPITLLSESKDSSDGLRWRIFSLTRETVTLQTAVSLGSSIQHRISVPATAVQAIRAVPDECPAVILDGTLKVNKSRGWVFTSADGLRVFCGQHAPDNDVFVFEAGGKLYELHIYYLLGEVAYEIYEDGRRLGEPQPLTENALVFAQRTAESMGGSSLRKLC
jgi:hypothetical protein